jgi:hypothetical protein
MGKKNILISMVVITMVTAPMLLALAGPDVPIQPSDLKKLSLKDLLEKSEVQVKGMQRMLKDSFALLEKSIGEKKPEEVTMRREAITAMKGLVRLSEDGLVAVQQYAAERDRERVEHEYVKIVLASSKISELYAQVQSVGGVFDLEVADVDRKMLYVGSLPMDSVLPSQFREPDVMPDPPVFASPYF